MKSRKLVLFSDELCSQLPCPPQGNEFYYDQALQQLALRLSSAGDRQWMLVASVKEKRTTKTLGSFPQMSSTEARRHAVSVLVQLERGDYDPGRRTGRALTCDRLMQKYIDEYAKPFTSNWKNALNGWNRHKGSLATRPVRELSRADVQQWVSKLGSDVSEGVANRRFNDLRAAIRWAGKMGLVRLDTDPTEHIKTFFCEGRTRYLTRYEWDRLRAVLEQNPSDSADALMLLFATGARKSNVLTMRWEEVDVDNKVWTVPAGKAKSKRTLVLPLTVMACQILEKRRTQTGGIGYVFPSDQSPTGRLTQIDHTWKKLRARAGLQDVHVHDLRHTVGSWLGMSGASAFVIKEALGHANLHTTVKYTHLDKSVVRNALEDVQAPAQPATSGNVIRFKSGKKTAR